MYTVQPSVVIIINLTYSTSALHVYVLISISTCTGNRESYFCYFHSEKEIQVHVHVFIVLYSSLWIHMHVSSWWPFLSWFAPQEAPNYCLSVKSGLNDFRICGKCQYNFALISSKHNLHWLDNWLHNLHW